MADDIIRIPSSQGGITRYFDEYKSKIELSPGYVIIFAILVMVLVILLTQFASAPLGLR